MKEHCFRKDSIPEVVPVAGTGIESLVIRTKTNRRLIFPRGRLMLLGSLHRKDCPPARGEVNQILLVKLSDEGGRARQVDLPERLR